MDGLRFSLPGRAILDKPGFIGALGMLLGNANVNIAAFNLGRLAEGSDAICLVLFDAIPS